MGRRVRHLNPVHAGAGFALDARFRSTITLSGADVSQFTSRPGRTFEFTPQGGNGPEYLASVSAAANQPGLSFVASNSERLVSLNTRVIPAGSNGWTCIDFSTGSSSDFITMCQRGNSRTTIGCQIDAIQDLACRSGVHVWVNGSNQQQTLTQTDQVNNTVNYYRQNGTSQQLQKGKQPFRSRTSIGTLRSGTTSSNYNNYRTGVFHASCLFATTLPPPLLHRIRQHYAFSFKSPI